MRKATYWFACYCSLVMFGTISQAQSLLDRPLLSVQVGFSDVSLSEFNNYLNAIANLIGPPGDQMQVKEIGVGFSSSIDCRFALSKPISLGIGFGFTQQPFGVHYTRTSGEPESVDGHVAYGQLTLVGMYSVELGTHMLVNGGLGGGLGVGYAFGRYSGNAFVPPELQEYYKLYPVGRFIVSTDYALWSWLGVSLTAEYRVANAGTMEGYRVVSAHESWLVPVGGGGANGSDSKIVTKGTFKDRNDKEVPFDFSAFSLLAGITITI
jgi:hypothetical protein